MSNKKTSKVQIEELENVKSFLTTLEELVILDLAGYKSELNLSPHQAMGELLRISQEIVFTDKAIKGLENGINKGK